MALREQQRAVYRSMQGKEVDMHKLIMQNEMTVAVGNAKVNARGDEIGPGGKIILKKDDTLTASPNSVPNQQSTHKVEVKPIPVEASVKPSKQRKDNKEGE
jgi:hypothetical protein